MKCSVRTQIPRISIILFALLSFNLNGCLRVNTLKYPESWPSITSGDSKGCPNLNGTYTLGSDGGYFLEQLAMSKFNSCREAESGRMVDKQIPYPRYLRIRQSECAKYEASICAGGKTVGVLNYHIVSKAPDLVEIPYWRCPSGGAPIVAVDVNSGYLGRASDGSLIIKQVNKSVGILIYTKDSHWYIIPEAKLRGGAKACGEE